MRVIMGLWIQTITHTIRHSITFMLTLKPPSLKTFNNFSCNRIFQQGLAFTTNMTPFLHTCMGQAGPPASAHMVPSATYKTKTYRKSIEIVTSSQRKT